MDDPAAGQQEMALNLLRSIVLATTLISAHGAMAQTVEESLEIAEVEAVRPGPPPPLPDMADPNSRSGETLNEPGPRSGIPKALRSSANKAGGPANDLNPSGAPQEAPLPRPDLGKVVAGQELFHGNYCGAGQRGSDLPPTDDLDAACQRHDACYDTAGYRSCACDRVLKREAAAVSERPRISLQVRQRALSVAEAADAMSCQTP